MPTSRYGNTHTLATSTARASTYFREEARHLVRSALHCTHEDAVVFVGQGVTGACHLFVQMLERARWHLSAASTDDGAVKDQ